MDDCDVGCGTLCNKSESAPKEKKVLPIVVKSFTLMVNDTEIEVTARDIKDACENDNTPWILRRIYNDEDLLRAALLKLAK